MADKASIALNIRFQQQGSRVETRSIIAFILLALLGLIALAGALVVARARRDHRR